MRRKGFFRGALWALLIGNIFQLIYTLHDGQANRTIYLGWNQYLFYAGAACLLFGRHKEETNAEKTSAGETSTEETSDAKTLLCFINGVIGLFGILYVECTEDRPGIKCVRHDSWQILQPTPNHPEDYLIHCYRNGNFYEGMTRIYTYGSGRRKHHPAAAVSRHRLAKHECARYIVMIIAQRLTDRFADSLQTRKMYHGIYIIFVEYPLQRTSVKQVRFIEPEVSSGYAFHTFK